ncbi:hypothetical protein KIK06_20975 [Nocardiopsis sp. EMB25]|uniref:hypothetical protein n=1 Tax=Nocardiopsis sp. EMB25 TaxID=2835867 RepID=UPI0022841BB3|nr:hypothetical protein [Nocardiopsis sp. EMB25]MCY9786371.1 hypothetical protein [Nocardiopsis sp. EMB25]
MNRHTAAVLVAAGGAAAYAVSKVELALSGRLGMPGFPAPQESYATYDPLTGQLSNAAVGAVLVVLILGLLRPPVGTFWRWALVLTNAVGAAMVGAGVLTFGARATGLLPGLGAPADGVAAWAALAVGAVWVVAWAVATWTSVVRIRS